MGRFVGVDLHRNSFLVCFFGAEKGEKCFLVLRKEKRSLGIITYAVSENFLWI